MAKNNTKMRLGTMFLLFALTVTSCGSTAPKHEEEVIAQNEKMSFHGITIAKELQILNSRDSVSSQILLLSENSLDGFWTSFFSKGEKYQTQLYLNGILNTSWYYKDNRPAFQNYDTTSYSSTYSYRDTAELYQSIRNKLKNYKPSEAPGFIEVKNQEFLEIVIERKYVTHKSDGSIDRELLLVNNDNLDGFWLEYDGPNMDRSSVVFNNTFHNYLHWSKNRLLILIPDTVLGGYGGYIGRDEDSVRIVTSIQDLFGKHQVLKTD